MKLTKEQKDLIFYTLEGFLNSLYWDEEFDEIDSSGNSIYFQMSEINKISSAKVSLREFQRFVEQTMNAMRE